MTRRGWLWTGGALVGALLFAKACVRIVPGGGAPVEAASAPAPAGALVVPVAGVPAARLSDTFAQARGEERRHDAIDIPAPRGTPVLAAAAGRVEKLFWSALGGRTLYIRAADGPWIDYYAHLDAYAPGLAEGATVAAGQPIATVGATGDAAPDAPHLHFAMSRAAPGDRWYQGVAVNPYPLLVAGRR